MKAHKDTENIPGMAVIFIKKMYGLLLPELIAAKKKHHPRSRSLTSCLTKEKPIVTVCK